MHYNPVRAPNPQIGLYYSILPHARNCSRINWIRNGILSQAITRRRSDWLLIEIASVKRGAEQSQIGSGVILLYGPMNETEKF